MSRFFCSSPIPRGIAEALFLSFAIFFLFPGCRAYGSDPIPKSDPAKIRLTRNYGALPLTFESNQGQAQSSIRFLSNANGYSILFKDREVDMLLSADRGGKEHDANMLRMRLGDSDAGSTPTGEAQSPETVNYLLGNDPAKWRTGVQTFGKVRYTEAFPGVDLLYYGSQNRLEFDFQVAPGADAKAIRLQFVGARKLRVDHDGNLVIAAANGSVNFHKPVIYQSVDGIRRIPVDGRFRLLSRNTVGFQLGAYDHAKPLIIDPILSYSTFLNFPSYSYPTRVAVDAEGEAYITGTAPILPITTPGAFQGSNMEKSGDSVFIAKFNQAGSALVYCTYLGGRGNDVATAIALDAQGDAYVVGQTSSTDFPTSTSALQSVNKVPNPTGVVSVIGSSGFVSEINSTGTALVYSTYLGGSTGSEAMGVAVDSSGNAYVAGSTADSDFPTTSGAFQSENKTPHNPTGFVSKINPNGTALVYSTYLGGSSEDLPQAIAIDASSDVYVAGGTYSTDFPTTSGAFQTTNNSHYGVGFVTKLNPAGAALIYSTYLGGSDSSGGPLGDQANAIAVDAPGDAYLTGFTSSADFPVTPGAFQTSIGRQSQAAFVTELNPLGTAPVYSTYLGGSTFPPNWINLGLRPDAGVGIALDSSGDAYVAGPTFDSSFPTTPGAFKPVDQDPADFDLPVSFVTELNSTGASLLYSTYLAAGEPNSIATNLNIFTCNCITGLALDSQNNPYVTGTNTSFDFPVTPGSYETGPGPAFLTKFNASEMKQLPVPTVNITANANPQAPGVPVTFTVQVVPTGGAGMPTGTVSFELGIFDLPANLDASGTATFTTTALGDNGDGGPGTNTVSAYYFGDANNAPASGSTTETITAGTGNKLPVTISVNPSANPAPYGSPVTFNISVTDPSGKGTPAGSVEMLINQGPAVGWVPLDPNGNAAITVDSLNAGANGVEISFFPANTSYDENSVGYTENVTPVGVTPTPVLSLPSGTYPAGQTLTITDAALPDAVIVYGPTGTTLAPYTGPITLTQSETLIAVAAENGYANSNSAMTTYTITGPPDFAMAFSSTALTVDSGGSATTSLTITPANGFNQTVSFACSGLPAGVSCSFAPATVTPGASAATTTLTIAATTTARNSMPTKFPFLPVASFALTFGWFAFGKRRFHLSSLLALASAVVLLSLSACGGGGATNPPNPSPTPTTSTVTVTATAGSLSRSQNLSLTLN